MCIKAKRHKALILLSNRKGAEMSYYLSVGISGSGKTSYYKTIQSKVQNCILLSKDDIRKELTGNVSNLTKEEEVEKIFLQRLETYSKNKYQSIYICNTNLSEKYLRQVVETISKNSKDQPFQLHIFLFMDSYKPTLCKERVKKDLDAGEERSNTLLPCNSYDTVIDWQYEKFTNFVKDNLFKSIEGLQKEFNHVHIDVFPA